MSRLCIASPPSSVRIISCGHRLLKEATEVGVVKVVRENRGPFFSETGDVRAFSARHCCSWQTQASKVSHRPIDLNGAVVIELESKLALFVLARSFRSRVSDSRNEKLF